METVCWETTSQRLKYCNPQHLFVDCCFVTRERRVLSTDFCFLMGHCHLPLCRRPGSEGHASLPRDRIPLNFRKVSSLGSSLTVCRGHHALTRWSARLAAGWGAGREGLWLGRVPRDDAAFQYFQLSVRRQRPRRRTGRSALTCSAAGPDDLTWLVEVGRQLPGHRSRDVTLLAGGQRGLVRGVGLGPGVGGPAGGAEGQSAGWHPAPGTHAQRPWDPGRRLPALPSITSPTAVTFHWRRRARSRQ